MEGEARTDTDMGKVDVACHRSGTYMMKEQVTATGIRRLKENADGDGEVAEPHETPSSQWAEANGDRRNLLEEAVTLRQYCSI